MEDITSVLWIILVAAGVLFSAAKSNSAKRKQAERRAAKASETKQTAYSQTPPHLPVNAPGNNISCNFSAMSDTAFIPDTDHTSEAAAATELSSEQEAGFDLRKAVIYSEILRPKFEDLV